MSEKFVLSTADYAIFGLMLVISAAIGLYFRIFGRQQKTNDEYLLAGKDMSIFPVSLSLMATFMSATTLMGIPTEMYVFGTNMTFMNVGFIVGPIVAMHLFLPVYFRTGTLTAYEYLERRFGKTTRRIISVIFILQHVLFNGVSLYAPALALSAVTNFSMWTAVIAIGVVCTFYCTLGGMKAVVWTDVFQSILMYVCLISIIIKGCLDLGGVENIFKSAYDGGRILLPTFKMDFSTRYTMWSVTLQGIIITTFSYGGSQTQVQRQLTLKNIQRSKMANLLSIPMIVTFQLLCCFCGIIFYVYFKSCDPLTSPERPIQSSDQLMPYYISLTMKEYVGLPGLCVAGIFSATLSTISSSVNSMAAVTYEDIIKPTWPNLSGPVFITKCASVFYGALSIVVTFIVASMGNLIKASVLVVGMVSGPALGVFLLASLTTTANEMGVNLGVLAGFLLAGFITFVPNSRHYPPLPVESNCSETFKDVMNASMSAEDSYLIVVNTTEFSRVTPPPTPPPKAFPPDNFPVSYMWISPLCLSVCVIVGYFGSWFISYIRGTSISVPPELLSPVRQRFYRESRKRDNELSEKKIPKDVATSTRF